MINWSLPLFLNEKNKWKSDRETLNFLINNKQLLKEDVEIESVYGAPPYCIWDGGRVLAGEMYSLLEIKEDVEYMNSNGIKVILTFSNPLIEEKHLYDYYCNSILEIVSKNKLNAVKVSSSVLEDYIRENYPQIEVYSSIIKFYTDTLGEGHNIRDILPIQEKYEKFVITGLFYIKENREFLLNEIDKDKAILMANDECPYTCPFFKKHALELARAKLNYGIKGKENELKCYIDLGIEPTMLDPEDVEEMASYGFKYFKMRGRSKTPELILELIENYLFKDHLVEASKSIYNNNL